MTEAEIATIERAIQDTVAAGFRPEISDNGPAYYIAVWKQDNDGNGWTEYLSPTIWKSLDNPPPAFWRVPIFATTPLSPGEYQPPAGVEPVTYQPARQTEVIFTGEGARLPVDENGRLPAETTVSYPGRGPWTTPGGAKSSVEVSETAGGVGLGVTLAALWSLYKWFS